MRTSIAVLAGLSAVATASAGMTFESDIVASVDGSIQFSGALGYSVIDESTNSVLSSGGNNVRNAVWEFDLQSIPEGATITGATLQLQTSSLISNLSSGALVHFHVRAGDGVVTEDDHQNLAGPTTLSATEIFATGGSGTPIGTVLDIAFTDLSGLQTLVDDGEAWASVRAQTFNFVTFQTVSLDTADSTAVVPTLVVEYIPAPGAIAVLGLAGLAGVRRRRA